MFHPTAQVYLNGMEVKTTQISDEILFVEAFSYPVPAEVALYVRNPDGDSDHISLFYVDQDTTELNDDIDIQGSLKSSTELHPSLFLSDEETDELVDESETEEEKVKVLNATKDVYKRYTPSISTITPILSPPSGTTITITGYHFAQIVRVGFGSMVQEERTRYVRRDEKIECSVRCQSPILPEGQHSVSIINPKGGKACMQNVLLYVPYDKWRSMIEPDRPTSPRKSETPSLVHPNPQSSTKRMTSPRHRVWG